MKAQDFIKTYEKISDDNRHSTFFKSRTMFEFAEDYHQAKLNLLTIPVVVLQSEQLMQSCSVCGMHKHPVLGTL